MAVSTQSQLRQWREANFDETGKGAINEQDSIVRVMSYNILADYLAVKHKRELYPRTPCEILDWTNRWKLIFSEICDLEPDILCLQEVDQFFQIQSDLSTLGYDGEYLSRSGGCNDGCATFWKREIQIIKTLKINFSAARVLKDNVVLLTVFRIPCARPFPFIVANTHILFNPKRGDIKLAQVRVLCDEVFKLAKKHNGLSVMCGDFNSAPQSGIHNFLTQGSIHLSDYLSMTLSGTLNGGFNRSKTVPFGLRDASDHHQMMSFTPWHPSASDPSLTRRDDAPNGVHRSWWPDNDVLLGDEKVESKVPYHRRTSLSYDFFWATKQPTPQTRHHFESRQFLIDRFQFLTNWKMDHLEITMGQSLSSLCQTLDEYESIFLLGHKLELKSSYGEVLGHEPEFTTLHGQAKQTVDYIFYTPLTKRKDARIQMEPIHVLEIPKRVKHSSLPNENMGSDHVSLCVDFRIKECHNRKRRGSHFRKRR